MWLKGEHHFRSSTIFIPDVWFIVDVAQPIKVVK
jgi:hypothetical protein